MIIAISDKQSFFDNFNNEKNETLKPIAESLQQIYYGAPGTGKSFTIDDKTDDVWAQLPRFISSIMRK